MSKIAWIDTTTEFKPGDMPPVGYLDRIEWANVQLKAGWRPKKCCYCFLWKFPQELSDDIVRTVAQTSRGLKVNIVSHICKQCAAKKI